MATLKQIRARIRTAKSIQQITRAMKLVAAARLKRAQDRVLQARPFSEKMLDLMRQLGAAGDLPDHPLLAVRPIQRGGVLVITSDRGLCGSFNTNILRCAEGLLSERPIEAWRLITVGKKGQAFFSKRGYQLAEHYSFPPTGATLSDAGTVTGRISEMFVSGETDAIYLVYSKFVSPLKQVPSVTQLLPIEPPSDGENGPALDYIFEPSAAELLGRLLPHYLRTLVYQAFIEANASEHGSRMTAMSAATDNAATMIRELTLHANTVRQAGITKELLEVVGGAEALSG
ncbi:MAG: ATP synthase gamma chain [Fimbriimonadales bacterium]